MSGGGGILGVTCLRNEGPYVVDWVAHHLAAGFDHVRRADHVGPVVRLARAPAADARGHVEGDAALRAIAGVLDDNKRMRERIAALEAARHDEADYAKKRETLEALLKEASHVLAAPPPDHPSPTTARRPPTPRPAPDPLVSCCRQPRLPAGG